MSDHGYPQQNPLCDPHPICDCQPTPVPDRDELVERLTERANIVASVQRYYVTGLGGMELEKDLRQAAARIQADAATIAGMTKWDRGGLLFDALCRVRCRNAADLSDRFTAAQREAYDKAVLACFAEIEAALKGGDHG